MRRIDSYIRKYGRVAGTIIYTILQKHACEARWKSFYQARLVNLLPKAP